MSGWIMAQRWHDVLFAHWPVDVARLRALVPAPLELDTFDGNAWIGVIPFRMTGVRMRCLPPLPGSGAFCELNVRTYVRVGDKPGIYFLSLDAANRLAVWTARRWFHLPYHFARMSLEDDGTTIRYASERRAGNERFRGAYRPTGEVYQAKEGDLDHWLTERYRLYTHHMGHVYCGPVAHRPWPLQPAAAEIETNMAPVALEGAPLPHFARRVDARVWAPYRIV